MKIVAVSVRDKEFPLYEQLNKKYQFDLTCYPTGGDIYDESIYQNADYVISGNTTAKLSDDYFAMLKRNGVKLFVAKMTGIAQIDLSAVKRNSLHLANVQNYSPNAISELALALALSLNRNLYQIQLNNRNADFTLNYPYFKEIRDCVVGIYGIGRIGVTTAKLFNSLGSRVIGYNPTIRKENEQFLTYVDIPTLQRESDILILHAPYVKNQNYHVINADFIAGMKPQAIIINVARGELVDLAAVNEAISRGQLAGFGCDVIENEQKVFAQKLDDITDEVLKQAINLYPKVIITPHIGAHTITARTNQIEIAFKQILEFEKEGSCQYLQV
ncbi:MAG: NAD(P)-dependent oxidoreductase [Erysipelotrichaceae bacterium]